MYLTQPVRREVRAALAARRVAVPLLLKLGRDRGGRVGARAVEAELEQPVPARGLGREDPFGGAAVKALGGEDPV